MDVSDWKYWCQRSKVQAWQAIAISLGLDPRKIPQSSDGYPALRALPNARAKKEFDERWSLLTEAMRSDSQLFTTANVVDHNDAELLWVDVGLRQVAAWLKSIGRDLPVHLLEEMPEAPERALVPISSEQPWVAIAWEEAQKLRKVHPKWKDVPFSNAVHDALKARGVRTHNGRGKNAPSADTIRKALRMRRKNS